MTRDATGGVKRAFPLLLRNARTNKEQRVFVIRNTRTFSFHASFASPPATKSELSTRFFFSTLKLGAAAKVTSSRSSRSLLFPQVVQLHADVRGVG